MGLLQNMYVVGKGDHTGQFLALIDFDEDKKIYSVLGLPESDVMYISEHDINDGIENNILELIEKLPDMIFNDCQSEFNHRKTINT